MIAVLDFGSQYTHLITRKIREFQVKAEIFEHDVNAEILKEQNVKGIILSGGPSSVYEKNAPTIDIDILKLNVPVLGICYGHQLLVYILRGKVKKSSTREYGSEIIHINSRKSIFEGLNKEEKVWFSHGDVVEKLPRDFIILANTKNTEVAAYCNQSQNIFGMQFHPEVVHTPGGKKILQNFVLKICREKENWKISDVKNRLIDDLKFKIGDKKVIIGVSGGVDSSVAAVLLRKAIGKNLYCVFIDTGLLRKNDTLLVENTFKRLDFINFSTVNASKIFLSALKDITDPEEKRKIFAKAYFQVFTDTAKKMKKDTRFTFLAQGTIYPDRVESGKTSKTSSLIKSHHNLSVPEALGLKVIEPLADFYKDEVRKLGKSLKIPEEILARHPFPGPGLSIRILGKITIEKIKTLQEVDAIFIEELKKSGYYNKVWQAFVVMLSVKSVGVMGDERTYNNMVSLRAVTSKDAMTCDWADLPTSLLKTVSSRIVNEVKGVNRVLYDISQKPPATIEYE